MTARLIFAEIHNRAITPIEYMISFKLIKVEDVFLSFSKNGCFISLINKGLEFHFAYLKPCDTLS